MQATEAIKVCINYAGNTELDLLVVHPPLSLLLGIKVVLGVGERKPKDTLSGRLLLYNAMSFRFHEVALKPRACQK